MALYVLQVSKGTKSLYDLYELNKDNPDWLVVISKASETKILPEKALEEAKASMPLDLYNQESECDFYGIFTEHFILTTSNKQKQK